MKNIFKMMGIALLACSMIMVSCKKDDENTSEGGGQGGQTAGTLKVTFGNAVWTPSVSQVVTNYVAQYGLGEFLLMKESESMPMVDMMISVTPGSYTQEATLGQAEPSDEYPEGYNYYSWPQNMEIYGLDYYESTAIPYQTQSGGTGYMGDWQPKRVSLTATSFDANTLKATLNLSATMYDYYSWNADIITNASDCDEQQLNIVANDYQFTLYQSSK